MYCVLIWFFYNNVLIFGKFVCNWWNWDGFMIFNLRYFRKWIFGYWIDFSFIFEFCEFCWLISSWLFIMFFISGCLVNEKLFLLYYEKGNNRVNLMFNYFWFCFKFCFFDVFYIFSVIWKINLIIRIIFFWRENIYDYGVLVKS